MRLQVPRCLDHHNHYTLYMALASCPSLEKVIHRRAALEMISLLPADRPTLVTGWHSDRFDLTVGDLRDLPPVVVINFSLHGFVMNDAAAGMAADAGFPVVPSSALDAERMMPDVLSFFGRFSRPGQGVREAFVARLRAAGIYGVHDMLFIPDVVADGDDAFLAASWLMPGFRGAVAGSVPCLAGCKLFCDGALGARTAAIADGFVGGGEPVLTHEDAELAEVVTCCLADGGGLAIHAIGDLAIEQVTGVLERVAGGRTAGIRLEHVQFITKRQAMRAREMGLVLSMQPNFSSDSIVYADRLRPATRAANNPFRMLIDEAGFTPGRDLIFGSDGMPHGIADAVRNALFPPMASQSLSMDELLAGYAADPSQGFVTLDIDYSAKTVFSVP